MEDPVHTQKNFGYGQVCGFTVCLQYESEVVHGQYTVKKDEERKEMIYYEDVSLQINQYYMNVFMSKIKMNHQSYVVYSKFLEKMTTFHISMKLNLLCHISYVANIYSYAK